MRSKLLRWYLYDGGILHRPGVFLSADRAFLPSPCGTRLLHCHPWGAATGCHVNFKCNQVHHRNEEYFIPGTSLIDHHIIYRSVTAPICLFVVQSSLMHIIHHTIMRVGNPSNILLSPLPSNSAAFIYSFLPALVRILWIVVFSHHLVHIAPLQWFLFPVILPSIHDYARRCLVCYCTAFFTHSLISFLLSLAFVLPFFARHCLFTQLRLRSHVRLAPHVYYPLMM